MSDAEIIKALEEMRKNLDDGYTTCLDYGGKRDMQAESDIHLYGLVIDLINRLQAKVEHYKKSRDKYQDDVMYLSKQCDELQAENERLQDAIDEQDIEIASLWKRIEEAKAEAYKEFAERFKKEYNERFLVGGDTVDYIIDNLLKEMERANNV